VHTVLKVLVRSCLFAGSRTECRFWWESGERRKNSQSVFRNHWNSL